jgi:hypothetical protein
LRYKTVVVLFFCSFVIIFFLWWLSGKPLYDFLSLQKPVTNPDLLLAEGWMDRDQLKKVEVIYNQGNYSGLITTGIALSPEYVMGKNGIMDFRFDPGLLMKNPIHLAIHLRGTLSEDQKSKFIIFVNNQRIGSDSVANDPKSFAYSIRDIDTISLISIQFINDALIGGKDRNLLITSVAVNSVIYSVNDTNVYYRVMSGSDSATYRSARCKAIVAKNILMEYGVKQDKIKAICTGNIKYSKTLSTASHTMHAIDSIFSPPHNLKINLVSFGPHSRRTYMAFKKAASDYDIGVVSIDESTEDDKINRLRNLRELLGIILIMILPAK